MQNDYAGLNLKGKRAFISGGTRGLGLEIVKSFIKAGADVSFCGRNSLEVIRIESELKSSSYSMDRQEIIGVTADISNANQIKTLKNEISNKLGDIDILVCNAGVLGPINPLI